MPTTVALSAFPAFYDDFGNPLAGGKVYTYAAGTVTPKATWQDRDGLVLNSNPIVLDASGRADIWLSLNEPYDIVVKNADESQVIRDVLKFYGGADPGQLTAAGIVPATGGSYTGPVDFTGGATFGGTPAQDLSTLDSLNIAAVQTSNLWMNSEFYINQRGSVSPADGNYCHDRVVALAQSGSVTATNFITGGTALSGNLIRFTQPDATPKRIGMVQIVEARDCHSYRGKSLALGAQVRCSVNATIRCALVAWTGTQDSPTRDLINNWASTNYTASNFFIANTLTIATAAFPLTAATWADIEVSSSSAGGVVAPLTMENLYMVFWTDTTLAQNALLDFAAPRCGLGTKAPRWTPPNMATELNRCQRYYEAGDAVLNGYMVSGSSAGIRVQFKATKRKVPTLGYAASVITNVASGLATLPTTSSLIWYASPTSTGAFAFEGTWTADADF